VARPDVLGRLPQPLREALGGGGGTEHKGLGRGAIVAFLLQGFGAAIAFALQVLLGGWLGAKGYGSYSFTLAWAGLLAVAIGLGLPSTVLRFVPAFVSHEDWPRLRGILRTSFLITAAVTIGAAALASAAVLLAFGGHPAWETIAGIWLVPLLAFRTLLQEMVRGFRRIALAYGPSMVLRPALVIAGAAIYLASGHDLTSVAALSITVAAMVLMLATQGALFWRGLGQAVKMAIPQYETRAWMKVALPLLLIASFAVVLSETDIVMVGLFLGPKQAGIYTAAAKTAGVVGLILLSVNAIAAPMFSSSFAQGRLDELATLASRVAKWIFWPTLAASILLALAAKPILGLFGSQFSSANWILTVLLVGQLVSAAVGSVGYLMTLTGHQRDAAWAYGWVAVIHVGLNAIAIPTLGAIGAAVATTLSVSIWNIWLHALVVRRLHIHPSIAPRLLYRGS
jgi:O-antigen/teichoic acid export membrane protein